jgi:hypothetical protein
VTPERVLAELETLSGRLGVGLRTEPIGPDSETRGGLCWIHGKPVVLIDASLPLASRISVLAKALSQFDLESLYVSPFVRSCLEQARRLDR